MTGDVTPAAPQARAPVLEISNLSKAFPGTQALDHFDLELYTGQVHALVGQNGSGKSTFIKILSGFHSPGKGCKATFRGTELRLGHPTETVEAGIRFVHQDLGLIGSASAVENLAIVAGYCRRRVGTINWRAGRAETRQALRRLGCTFDVDAPVGTLQKSEQVGVAIARALVTTQDKVLPLLVLDEPTVALPRAEVDRLFDVLRNLKDQGTAILFVSHRLDEVFAAADVVTVVRDGRRIVTTRVDQTDKETLIHQVLGRRMEQTGAAAASSRTSDVCLSLHAVSSERLRELDLEVHVGEILGITGLNGSGREDIAGAMFGSIPITGGEIRIDGNLVSNLTPRKAMLRNVAFVPANRRQAALFSDATVRENLTLPSFNTIRRGPFIGRRAERTDTRSWMERLSVKAESSETNIMSLSGGNQQKVIIARWLRLSPRVLLLDEPTQGVDVGAKQQIYQLLHMVAAAGSAVVISSTDSEELAETCDRVVVLSNGRAVAELAGDNLTLDNINHELVLA
jgi:ribose transport system ATP-binding protein